ncbi:MAG: hypothetical protein R2942_18160 [Ignavibacteria bacterium]
MFTKDQRDTTTILFGGLTWKHERLIKGALEGIGYKTEMVPTPSKKLSSLVKSMEITVSVIRHILRSEIWLNIFRVLKLKECQRKILFRIMFSLQPALADLADSECMKLSTDWL